MGQAANIDLAHLKRARDWRIIVASHFSATKWIARIMFTLGIV